MKDYIVYDIETQIPPDKLPGGWSDVFEMKMSSGVAWCSKTDQFYFFGHEDNERIKMCEFLNGKTTVTFNGIMFDSRVLLGNDRKVGDHGDTSNADYKWDNIDIFAAMWKRILNFKGSVPDMFIAQKAYKYHKKGVYNLDSILWNTLRIKKNGDGADAPKLFEQGRFRELYEYNLQDARCERDLYKFILKHKYIVNGEHDVVTFD